FPCLAGPVSSPSEPCFSSWRHTESSRDALPSRDKYVFEEERAKRLFAIPRSPVASELCCRVDSLKLVTVKLPEKLITDVDQLVKAGIYHSRSDAIRAAVRDLLRRELRHTSQG